MEIHLVGDKTVSCGQIGGHKDGQQTEKLIVVFAILQMPLKITLNEIKTNDFAV
jgi:hypothetical protein